ncbi:hypothetical protein J6590_067465 [Homalodisca vitripennis]|nr:hypothetical protein J6590_067465 [Homalodisca vitripennis]
MEEAATRLSAILARAESLTVDPRDLPASHKLLSRMPASPRRGQGSLLYFLAGVVTVTVAVAYGLQLYTHAGLARALLKWRGYDIYRERADSMFRKIVSDRRLWTERLIRLQDPTSIVLPQTCRHFGELIQRKMGVY